MRLTLLITAVLFQFGTLQAQIEIDGFGEIRLGDSYEDIKKKIKETDEIPEYAWFAPMTLEEWVELGEDSSTYQMMLDEEAQMEEEMGWNKITCTFKKKYEPTIGDFQVKCAELVFENDTLISMTLALDSENVTAESKLVLLDQLVQAHGDTYCSYSVNYDVPPFYCTWENDNHQELTVSDMVEPGYGPGVSVNITFGSLNF